MKNALKNELRIYKEELQRQYELMPVEGQRKIRVRFMQVISVGVLLCINGIIYSYVPLMIRVIALPLSIAGVWFFVGRLARDKTIREIVERPIKQIPTLPVIGFLIVVACLMAGFVWGGR